VAGRIRIVMLTTNFVAAGPTRQKISRVNDVVRIRLRRRKICPPFVSSQNVQYFTDVVIAVVISSLRAFDQERQI
jgi:hypothetical protein